MHQTSEGVCLLAVGWQSTGGAHGLRCLSWAGGGEAAGTPSSARRVTHGEREKGLARAERPSCSVPTG